MLPPIGKDDVLVDLGIRQYSLPPMYKAASHPKKTNTLGDAYYYLQDTTKEGLEKTAKLEKVIKIPRGPEKKALALGRYYILAWQVAQSYPQSIGFMKLKEGDHVFCRSLSAPADGSRDSTVCWVTGG